LVYNNVERVRQRCYLDMKYNEVQIFTPFIFGGPRFLRELKENS